MTPRSFPLLSRGLRWETWDHNLRQLRDVSGGCEDGTTCVFVPKDGHEFQFTLSDVEKHKTLTFSGVAAWGTVRCEGRVRITPVDRFSTKLEYSFGISGSVGFVVALLRTDDVVTGTEAGLANMVRLSEQAQGSEVVTMN